MALALIAACGRGGVIGVDNKLPWHLPADLKKFKAVTTGSPIIMGRKTYESIGRALPGRLNIIVSRNAQYRREGCDTANSIEAALKQAQIKSDADIFVIGGAEIYRQTMSLAQRLYITEVDIQVDNGDAFFPPIEASLWEKTAQEHHPAAATAPAYTFVSYERRRAKQ